MGEIPTKKLTTLRIHHCSHGARRGETRCHKLARTTVARKQSRTARGRSRGKKDREQGAKKFNKRKSWFFAIAKGRKRVTRKKEKA